MLQYKLDNEFELVFVAGYQKVLKLSYVDKFLDDLHQELRDRYKNVLADKLLQMQGLDLELLYQRILKNAETWGLEMQNQKKSMRTFEESRKSKKTVASMIDRPSDEKNKKSSVIKTQPKAAEIVEESITENIEVQDMQSEEIDSNETKFMEPKVLPRGVMRKPGPGKFM